MSDEAVLRHEECWLRLPWLANGSLPVTERAGLEAHVRACAECQHELAWQRRACEVLAGPDRVTYAPGPSFRKLMRRIDAGDDATQRRPAPHVRAFSSARAGAHAAWRPPGLAWAASFLVIVALGLLAPVAYRWSQPLYSTHTASATGPANVLHVAFERSLPVGEVEELLQSAGARIVEGPGSTGIFGVAPLTVSAGQGAGPRGASRALRVLALRLRSDPRVRWVEPLVTADTDEVGQQPRAPSR